MTAVGRLRERVTIEQPVRLPDGAGGADVTWKVLASVWAEVVALAGTEVAPGARDEARQAHRITIRFRDDVTTEMRLSWRGQALNIRGARDPDGKRRWLAINAAGGAA